MAIRTSLSDGAIRVRKSRPEDAEQVFLAARESIEEVGRWMEWCHPAYGRDEAEQWVSATIAMWEKGTEFHMTVEAAGSGRFLGYCGINHIEHEFRMGNLGYWVRTSASGRGVATAATRLVAHFGLTDLGLGRVEIIAAVENAASQRVAEKAGATRESVARHRLWLHGVPHDAVVFSLTRDDLASLPPPPD